MDPVEGPNSDLAIDSSPQISDPVYFPVSLILSCLCFRFAHSIYIRLSGFIIIGV
jgi:hypothetical protein